MILCIKKRILAFLGISFVTVSLLAQQDLLNYENSLKFARYLINTQQYSFAAQEYERLHFLWPEDTTLIKELVSTYRLNQDCAQFANAYDMLSVKDRIYTSQAFAREYLKFSLSCKIDHPLYADIASLLDRGEYAFYQLGYYWAHQLYDSLFAYNHRNEEILSRSYPQLYSLTNDLEQQKYKKPALAVALSAILPGSGKAYSRRWGDAAVSFIFVTSSAYASYRAFKKKGIRSFNGWLFGGVALSFYSSNIYGSYKAARTYNDQVRHQYHQHAESIIHHNF